MSRNHMEDEKDIQFGHDEPEQEEILESEEEESEDSEEPSEDSEYQEESSDEEPSEDESDRPKEEKPKKRDKSQTRINVLQRERYRVIHDNERLRAENEEMKKRLQLAEEMKDLSSQAAMRQYDDNLATRFNQAKQAAAEAIESGDAKAQADAQAELSFVTNQIHELDKWKQKDEYERLQQRYVDMNQQQYSQQSQPTVHPDADYITQAWLEDNPWYNPNSNEYDAELAAAADELAAYLDNGLTSTGRSHAIRGDEYFQAFDSVINQCRANRANQRASQRRELNMKPVRGGASPARNQGYSSQHSQQMREKLSPAEREIAAVMKVSDAEYLRQKMNIRKGGR